MSVRNTWISQTNTKARDDYDRMLIIGGIAGIGAALALAKIGRKVTLVEKSPLIGSKWSSLIRHFQHWTVTGVADVMN